MLQYSFSKALCRTALLFCLLLITAPLATFAYEHMTIEEPAEPASVSVTPAPETPPLPAFTLITEDNAYLTSDQPVYDNLLVTERQQQNLPLRLPELIPYYGTKTVYLTFDDGPDPENTPYVLDLLKEYQIHATFFLVGKQAAAYPDLVKRIFAEGHAIGNHSYNHDYRDLYRSPDTYFAQLHQTDEIIKGIIGVRPRISRAPGGTVGHFQKAYWDRLKTEGYRDIAWNISSGDASDGKAADLYGNIAEQIQRQALWSHAIVLMHDAAGHKETMKALRNIIELFRSQGFEFKVVNMRTPTAW